MLASACIVLSIGLVGWGMRHQVKARATQALGAPENLTSADITWTGLNTLSVPNLRWQRDALDVECQGVRVSLTLAVAWPAYAVDRVSVGACRITRQASQNTLDNLDERTRRVLDTISDPSPDELAAAADQLYAVAQQISSLGAHAPAPIRRVWVDEVFFNRQDQPQIRGLEASFSSPTQFSGALHLASHRIAWTVQTADILRVHLRSAAGPELIWRGPFMQESAKISGSFETEFTLQKRDATRWRADLKMRVDALTLTGQSIAREAVSFPRIEVALALKLAGEDGTIEALGSGSYDAIPFEFSATARHELVNYATRLRFEAASPIACDRTLQSVPPGLLAHLHQAVQLAGSWHPSVTASFNTGDPNSFELEASGGTDCEIRSITDAWNPELLNDDAFLRARLAERGRVDPDTWEFVAPEAVPEHVYRAMQVHEDPDFDTHPGLSSRLFTHAIRTNWREGKMRYGASSLTQQIIKNLFLGPEKTLARKLEEALLAWLTDRRVSKARQLGVYMNMAQLGEGIYGVGAAADYYFQKSAAQLTPLESAYLAAILPWPWHGEAHRRAGRSPQDLWWQERIWSVLNRLQAAGYIDAQLVEEIEPYVVNFGELSAR